MLPFWNFILAGAQLHGGLEQSTLNKSEGVGSYDINTGKFYDSKKQERTWAMSNVLNPLNALRDPYLKPGEKILALGGLGGLFTNKRRERMEADQAADAAKYQAIRNKVDQLPGYQMAPEAQEKLALLQDTSKDVSELGQEITDIASNKLSKENPEAAIDRKLIANNNAEMLQAIQESGVNGSAVISAGKQTQSEYAGLSKKNLAYRMQAEQDLMNAKNNQAQLEMSGAQMEAEGLTGIISEKGKIYQSNLNKALTGFEMDLTRLTGQQMQQIQNIQATQQANAAATSGFMQAAASYFGNKR